jgi:probable selenium-dependent hydroxylase accessory protein YqeC
MVAFTGAGGKTTAAWRVMGELARAGERAIFTTTTRIFKPTADDVRLVLDPDPSGARMRRTMERTRFAVLAAGLGARGDPEQAGRSPYPAEAVKLVGLSPAVLNRLFREVPSVTWLVEADGARGRLLKAPAAHEPVIPSRAGRVIVLAGLEAIGEPVDERTVHRARVASQLLGTDTGVTITPTMIARLVRHPRGGLKGIPPGAPAVVLLTHWHEAAGGDGEMIAEQLASEGGITRVVRVDLSSPDEVYLLRTRSALYR